MMLHDLHYLTSQWYTLCQLWFTLIKYKNNELRTSLFCSKKTVSIWSILKHLSPLESESPQLCYVLLYCFVGCSEKKSEIFIACRYFSYLCNRLSIFLCWNHCFRLLSIKYQVCFILLPLMYVICIMPES